MLCCPCLTWDVALYVGVPGAAPLLAPPPSSYPKTPLNSCPESHHRMPGDLAAPTPVVSGIHSLVYRVIYSLVTG